MVTQKYCRFCNSKKTKYLFQSSNIHGRNILNNNEHFILRKCLECGCIFISNLEVNQTYFDKYYLSNYYETNKTHGILDNIWSYIYRIFSENKAGFILKCFKNRRNILSILDIGCGNGNFLNTLDSDIFEKNGVEINPQGIMLCKSKKINIYNKAIELIDFGEKKFDVITLWHVIEHLENPLKTIRKACKILSDNGILVFQVPNNGSLGFKCGKKYWFHLDSPRHLMIPNIKTINYLCTKNGLKIIRVINEFYDYPLDLFWSVRKSPIRFIVYPFYPIFKLLSKEHSTFICRKANL